MPLSISDIIGTKAFGLLTAMATTDNTSHKLEGVLRARGDRENQGRGNLEDC